MKGDKDMLAIQKLIDRAYRKAFGSTPLKERLDIIMGEAIELRGFRDVKNLREETGDILTAVIQLATESGWDAHTLVEENLAKIARRGKQYRSLSRKKRVAILGGAMDPPTKGHVATMEFILKACGEFDEAWTMPCFSHPFSKNMESPKHRLEMCRLATAHNPRLKVFDYEIRHKLTGDTYSLVKRLLDEPMAKDEFEPSLVIGLDNANTIRTWGNWEALTGMIRFVVVQRAGVRRDPKVNWYLKEPHMYLEQEGEIPMISSTKAREYLGVRGFAVKCHEAVREALGQPVMEYIVKNKLYSGGGL